MEPTIDSNKDFILFSKFYVFLKNFPIALIYTILNFKFGVNWMFQDPIVLTCLIWEVPDPVDRISIATSVWIIEVYIQVCKLFVFGRNRVYHRRTDGQTDIVQMA